MRLRPGALVVLEGLDRAGKSTQQAAFARVRWDPPEPLLVHMPSGLTDLTQALYRITEQQSISSPLARQLLHLACHAENLPLLVEARRSSGVILDRWWWSTVAYGWFGADLRTKMAESAFFGAIDLVWGGVRADVLFLFLSSFDDDPHNLPPVVEGYKWLAEQQPDLAVEVPVLKPDETFAFLTNELRRRSLIEVDPYPSS